MPRFSKQECQRMATEAADESWGIDETTMNYNPNPFEPGTREYYRFEKFYNKRMQESMEWN